MKNYYYIAGLIVAMDSYGRIAEQAEPYKIVEPQAVDISIQSEWCTLKEKYPYLSDSDGEYLATGKSFYKQLLDYDGLMVHSSAVVMDGKAYLFTADSGTGKSTHTNLWIRQFGNRSFILNDDKPALRLIDGVWYAYGTPWSGKNDISANLGAPIAGIACIERGIENQISLLSGKEAVLRMFKQVNRKTNDNAFRIKLLDLLDKLMTQVPIWKLKCNMEPEAAIVAYEAMSGKKWRNEV